MVNGKKTGGNPFTKFTTMRNATKLEKFVKAIEPIAQGVRNTTLYKVAHTLRKEFGLAGGALEAELQNINQTKCTTPLPDSEVATIARSVDKADIPIGEKPTVCRGQRGKKIPKTKHQTVFVVSQRDTLP